MRISKDWIDAYFSYGVDISNRRVFLGDIDHDSIQAVIKGMYLMETADSTKPVELFISSYGGVLYDALALYDIVQTLRCPVHTFAYGKCMSAAPLLLAAGEPGHRWVAAHVCFMYHDCGAELEGKGASLTSDIRHIRKLSESWIQLIAKHGNKTAQWWRNIARKPADFYFSAEEAIEWGLADSIWSER